MGVQTCSMYCHSQLAVHFIRYVDIPVCCAVISQVHTVVALNTVCHPSVTVFSTVYQLKM